MLHHIPKVRVYCPDIKIVENHPIAHVPSLSLLGEEGRP